MADETVITLLGAGIYTAKKGVDTVAGLVSALLMPSAQDAGTALRDYLRKRRKRAEAVVLNASALLEASAAPVVPVPGRVLFPILEAASFEDDETLTAMWTRLLASAGDARSTADVLPSFVTILRDLSPGEALLLKALYDSDGVAGPSRIDYDADGSGAHFNPRRLVLRSDDASQPPVTLTMPFNNFRVLADNLARLGLVNGSFWVNGEYSHLSLTPLGYHLVMVCVRYPEPLNP